MSMNPPCSYPSSPSLNPAVTPANIDIHASASVPAQPAAAPDDDGSSSPPRPLSLPPWPMLLLDSGASVHTVGDPRLLSDLHDVPAGSRVRVLDGTTLPITKVGDIQMPTAGFTISGVFLVPGLEFNTISVRQLSRQGRISTFFGGDRAWLYAGSELVGGAVAQENLAHGLYVLQFLRMQPAERFTWSQFLPLRIHTRKQQLRLRIYMQKQLRRSRIHMSGPPKLLLDSGASSHKVSDPRLLCSLRDAPAGLRAWVGDGNSMPVTKIGDIHVQGFTVPDVQLVPGFKADGVISVRRLARESGICSCFVGDRAELYAVVGRKLVGVAVAPRDNLAGLYILRTPKVAVG